MQDILLKMYDFNHKPEHWDIKDTGYYRRNRKSDAQAWGGGRTRRLLGVAFTLAFLCLLRFDEVLKIEMHHIEFISREKMKLTLPFRKTHQFGGGFIFCPIIITDLRCPDIKPFYLYSLPEDQAHLCPVRAVAEWVNISRIKEGHLFQRMYSGDQIADLDKNTPMVCCPLMFGMDHHSCRHAPITDIGTVLRTVP